MPFFKWIINRARERPTWLGLASLSAWAIGITFSPTQLDAVVAVGMAIAGTIAIFSADQTK